MTQDSASQAARSDDARRPSRGGRPALLSRERILDVARHIPARELTMPVVARRLDVSAAALYRHFESRDALLAALGLELAEGFELRAADPAAWREWLLHASEALFRFLIDNPVILAAPDWVYVDGMGKRLLETAYATLEGAGFDTVTAVETWGVVAGHAYLGARLLHDVPAPDDATARRLAADHNAHRWLALADARGTTDQRELLVHSLRWLVSILPAPTAPSPRRKNGSRSGA